MTAGHLDAQGLDARRLNASKLMRAMRVPSRFQCGANSTTGLDASTCNEAGCNYTPRDWMHEHAADLDATADKASA